MRLLVPVVLRALGVTLLFLTVLMPIADHHAAARLAMEIGGPDGDAHYLVMHHHPLSDRTHTAPAPSGALGALVAGAAAGADGRLAASSAVAPAAPALDPVGGGVPALELAGVAFATIVAVWRLGCELARRPPSRAVRVLDPPPRVALLSAA